MSAIDDGEHPGTARRKHRHDLGHEDHGPVLAAGTTRGIQILLGLWIALTLLAAVYALVDGALPRGPRTGTSMEEPRRPSTALPAGSMPRPSMEADNAETYRPT